MKYTQQVHSCHKDGELLPPASFLGKWESASPRHWCICQLQPCSRAWVCQIPGWADRTVGWELWLQRKPGGARAAKPSSICSLTPRVPQIFQNTWENSFLNLVQTQLFFLHSQFQNFSHLIMSVTDELGNNCLFYKHTEYFYVSVDNRLFAVDLDQEHWLK